MMDIQKITCLSVYQEIVSRYRRKGGMTNDYLQSSVGEIINEDRLHVLCGKDNAFFLVKKPIGVRVYYYVNNCREVMRLPDGDYVVEILFRGDKLPMTREIDYLKANGFDPNLTRDQYCASYAELALGEIPPTIEIGSAKGIDEAMKAVELFNAVFDNLSGDYISQEEVQGLVELNEVMVARDRSGRMLGALHHTKVSCISLLNHLAVCGDARRRGVGSALCTRWIELDHADEKSRYMLWVQRQNKAAIELYGQMGFRPNGKSTLSMIKRRNNGKTA